MLSVGLGAFLLNNNLNRIERLLADAGTDKFA